MISMTGFGRAEAQTDKAHITVQIATVNHRNTRVSVRSDVRDLSLEEQVRSRVQKALRRGSINVRVDVQELTQAALDLEQVKPVWQELARVAAELGAPTPRLEDACRLLPRSDEGDSIEHTAILAVVDEAVEACLAMRKKEGQALQQVFVEQAGALRDLRQQMATAAAGRVEQHAEKLQQRLQELVADRAELTPEHLIRELAVYADRIDITEELDRLDIHFVQLDSLIADADSQGKKIEFLLQEIGREINTTGSKANDAALQRLVVDGKSILDQLKEQAANVL